MSTNTSNQLKKDEHIACNNYQWVLRIKLNDKWYLKHGQVYAEIIKDAFFGYFILKVNNCFNCKLLIDVIGVLLNNQSHSVVYLVLTLPEITIVTNFTVFVKIFHQLNSATNLSIIQKKVLTRNELLFSAFVLAVLILNHIIFNITHEIIIGHLHLHGFKLFKVK